MPYKNVKIDHTARLLQETVIEAESLISNIEHAIKESADLLSKSEKAIIDSLLDNIKAAVRARDRTLISDAVKNFKSKTKKSITTKLNIVINDLLKGKDITQIK